MGIAAIILLILQALVAIPKLVDIVKEIMDYIHQRRSGRLMLYARLLDGIHAVIKTHGVDNPKVLEDLRDELKSGLT